MIAGLRNAKKEKEKKPRPGVENFLKERKRGLLNRRTYPGPDQSWMFRTTQKHAYGKGETLRNLL